jgi:rfaE bifunctional protein nucleotidyltransferase chain/domain
MVDHPWKIADIDNFLPLREGQRVVLCHGVFDVLHPGHIAHLREAAQLGDVLVVSVTADEHVNKGPGRPVFSTRQRAEQVAALACVDYVVVSHSATAREALEAIRPAYFVKGGDYEGTGILPEEGVTARAVGAQLRFTSAPVDSSSRVGNRAFATYPEGTERWLDAYRQRRSAGDILAALDRIAAMKVLVVGEYIIDRYTFVDTLAKSPREHHLSVKKTETAVNHAGGAVAVRRHLAGFVEQCHVIHQQEGIIKERFVERHERRKLFSVQRFPDTLTIGAADAERLWACGDYDLVIVTDYGHGLFDDRLRKTLEQARFLAVNCQTNSANYGRNLVTRWPEADFVCLDGPEYDLAVTHGWQPTNVPRVLLTRGKDGCNFGEDTPAFAVNVVDRVGAGDALFALAAPLVAAGVEPDIVAFIGSCAAAMQCETLGNERPVNPEVLRKFMARLLA